VVFFF